MSTEITTDSQQLRPLYWNRSNNTITGLNQIFDHNGKVYQVKLTLPHFRTVKLHENSRLTVTVDDSTQPTLESYRVELQLEDKRVRAVQNPVVDCTEIERLPRADAQIDGREDYSEFVNCAKSYLRRAKIISAKKKASNVAVTSAVKEASNVVVTSAEKMASNVAVTSDEENSSAELKQKCEGLLKKHNLLTVQFTSCIDLKGKNVSRSLKEEFERYESKLISKKAPVRCVPFVRTKGKWIFKRDHYAVAVMCKGKIFVVDSDNAYSKPIQFVKHNHKLSAEDRAQPWKMIYGVIDSICESAGNFDSGKTGVSEHSEYMEYEKQWQVKSEEIAAVEADIKTLGNKPYLRFFERMRYRRLNNKKEKLKIQLRRIEQQKFRADDFWSDNSKSKLRQLVRK